MTQEALNPLRRFYRHRLERYAWARRLKPLAVPVVQRLQMLHYALIWRIKYPVLRVRFVGSETLMGFGVALESLHQRMDAGARRTGDRGPLAGRSGAIAAAAAGFAFSAARAVRPGAKQGYSFFAMKSFAEYQCEFSAASVLLVPARREPVAMPTVLPDRHRQHLRSGEWPLAVPQVCAFTVDDAEVVGRCDFVFSGLHCLQHGLYDFKRDLPAEEMHGMVSIQRRRRLVSRAPSAHPPLEGPAEAITMVGSSSSNYVHWLTETGAKLALLEKSGAFPGLPLLVDADLHPNVMSALRSVNRSGREIIPLARGQVCRVGRAVVLSPVAYVPFDYRRGFDMARARITPDWAMYVPDALHALRDALAPASGPPTGPRRRIFIQRQSQLRQMQNAQAVEALLAAAGFEIVEPGGLPFEEQVRLFSQAEVIVAQAGAALGNILFAPRGCRIVILTAWSRHSIYYYFSNLAAILGQPCTLAIFDAQDSPAFHPAHRGLHVEVDMLEQAIAS